MENRKPMTAPDSGSFESKEKNIVPLMSNGTYPAILVGIIDMGTQDVEFEGVKRKRRTLNLSFEFPLKKELWYVGDTEAKPQLLSLTYTYSMATAKNGNKSALRKFIEAIFGPMTDQVAKNFDLAQLIGKLYNVAIIQVESKQGTMYNRIQSVGPFQNFWQNEFSQGLLNATNDLKIYSIDHDGFESTAFAKLYFWERVQIKESYEAQDHIAKGGKFSKLDENGNMVLEEGISTQQSIPAQGNLGGVPGLEMIDKTFTYQQFIEAGWTKEMLIQHGKAKLVAKQPVAPPVPVSPPAPAPVPQIPQVPSVDTSVPADIEMIDKAFTYQQFIQAGWTKETLIQNGKAVLKPVAPPVAVPSPAPPAPANPVQQFNNAVPAPVVTTPAPTTPPAVAVPQMPVAPVSSFETPAPLGIDLPEGHDDLPF